MADNRLKDQLTQPTQPTQAAQPVMSAQQVQDTIGVNQPPASTLQLSGMGQTGNRSWYDLMQPGGPAKTDTAAFMAAKPGGYNNIYAGAMQQGMNNLLSMQPFQYDVNADGLYQQIKDNYIKQGRQAMMDTQGQSAALTGGYGNSYGVQASQQAYQDSLGNLAGMIPQLADAAYGRYRDQISDQRANLEAMRQLENQDYTRWLSEQEDYQKLLKEMPALQDAQAAQIAAQIAAQMQNQYAGLQGANRTGQSGNGSIDLDTLIALNGMGLSPEQVAAIADKSWVGVDPATQAAYLRAHPEILALRAPDLDLQAYQAAVGDVDYRSAAAGQPYTPVPYTRTNFNSLFGTTGTQGQSAQRTSTMSDEDFDKWASR